MLVLPSLRGVPRFKRTSSCDPMVAKLALAAAGDQPIAEPRNRTLSFEVAALQETLGAWLKRLQAPLTIFAPELHVNVGRGEERWGSYHAAVVYLGVRSETLLGPVFHLEGRWKWLERKQQGLAAWALSTLDEASRHSFPVYTPSTAEGFGSWCWFRGELDETEVLNEYREEIGNPKAEPPADMITRKKLDAALPPFVQSPHPRLPLRRLEWMASVRGTEPNEIAKLVLALRAEIKASRRAKDEPDMETSDDDGMLACQFAATVRWNSADPMTQAYDDYVNEHNQAVGVEEAFGHFLAEHPKDLPMIQRAIERQFRIAALVEKLLPLIAERQR